MPDWTQRMLRTSTVPAVQPSETNHDDVTPRWREVELSAGEVDDTQIGGDAMSPPQSSLQRQ